MNKKQNKLSGTIRLLGGLLGETIIAQEGRDVFEMEEEIRKLAKAWRAGDAEAKHRLDEIIPSLVNNLPLAAANLKAFSTYFQLVNLAEERERVRILRERAESAYESNVPMDETIDEALGTLKREGVEASEIQKVLARMVVTPVFTAHPTESKRRTIRQILNKVSTLLKRLDSSDLFAQERNEAEELLRDHIVLLWQSDETRNRRPTVMDEVRNSGLYFFENTLFDLVPRIYEELDAALVKYFPETSFDVPSFLSYGSWIGGDRDGNPYVTTDVTEETLQEHEATALSHYLKEVLSMYSLLSPSTTRVNFSHWFLASLEKDRELVPEDEFEVLERFTQEPYRQKLILIYRRLMATKKQNEIAWKRVPAEQKDQRGYDSVDQFLNDLYLIRDSLLANQGERLVRGRFARLIRSAQVFGFHMASLDLRQHSKRHREAAGEIFARNQTVGNYQSLSESEKIEALSREIESPRSWSGGRKSDGQFGFTKETDDLLRLFRLIGFAQSKMGKQAIEAYIISMTQGVSHILEVLLLAHDADLFGCLDIVPLFETVDDLKAAPAIMQTLFDNPVYAKHLAKRGNQQQIMIGYSDSNKDGGYLRANWMLFTAQRQLAEVCQRNGIVLTLFHGRGGSIGRGGGPANRAILAQPPESVRGRIRITEQGEVVSSRYSEPEIAHRHLQQLVHAVLCSTGTRPVFEKIERWSKIMDELSSIAYRKYRSLVEREDFLEYFHAASPIDQIGQLNIGSRPSRRGATETLDDLRAIPWVFAWTQTRTDIPSWFGVGTGFQEWLAEGDYDSKLAELREMNQRWPFFRTLMSNVQLGMGRADMAISALYASLSAEHGGAVYEDIKVEFDLSKQLVLEVTEVDELLHCEPWLQHSIKVRNPYVDPLNYIQVELLKKLRSEPEGLDSDAIRHEILQSVNGIAAGLQSVG